jgi:hypothetical protein
MGFLSNDDYYDNETYEPTWRLLSESTHRARTRKSCGGGGQWIEVGQKYRKTVGLEDGVFTVFYAHAFDKIRWDAAMEVQRLRMTVSA